MHNQSCVIAKGNQGVTGAHLFWPNITANHVLACTRLPSIYIVRFTQTTPDRTPDCFLCKKHICQLLLVSSHECTFLWSFFFLQPTNAVVYFLLLKCTFREFISIPMSKPEATDRGRETLKGTKLKKKMDLSLQLYITKIVLKGCSVSLLFISC